MAYIINFKNQSEAGKFQAQSMGELNWQEPAVGISKEKIEKKITSFHNGYSV